MPYQIRRVAVIGAGTMGASIAGLVAGAGWPVLLLDIPPKELTPQEEAKGLSLEDPAVRNRIVRESFERMRKARPSNLFNQQSAELIQIGNTEDDFDKLAEADWILEAIIERPGPKQALMERIEAVRKPTTIVTSNTSGIPISVISEGRSEGFRQHFFGTHFFNPPRYLKLVEIIPGEATAPEALAAMSQFVSERLGKGVVVAKDRPNFIGNRVGTFSLMSDLPFILDNNYTVEEVDALSGPLIGRPRTATFRLLDQVGVDIMAFVSNNLYDAVPDDESREVFHSSDLLNRMVERGRLGKKAGEGFYKEVREKGKREFRPLDLETMEYQSPQDVQIPLVAEANKIKSLPERLQFLLKKAADEPDNRAAQLIAQTLLPVMAYAARRLPEIADSVADVDNAMRWGFAHEMGPFQIWDALGVPETLEMMRQRDLAVPEWVEQLANSDTPRFYAEQNGQPAAYNVATSRHEVMAVDERVIDLAALKAEGREVQGNKSASLVDLGDGVLCLEMHSKANTLDGPFIEMGHTALEMLKDDQWQGLVIGNQGSRFCAGANLMEMAGAAMAGQFDALEQTVRGLQDLMQGFRYAPKPVVTAPFGQTLGGGCELAMHSAHTVAAAETYMGLVEFGVGLIPGAGGCKELNRRLIAATAAMPGGDPLKAMQQVFETISQATVATSALESRDLGFLRDDDNVVMNNDYLLGEAKQAVLELANDYMPPVPGKHCYALGRDGLAAARIAIYSFVQSGFASEYDAFIAEKLAYVLCGGELSSAQPVDEQYILDLERAAFIELTKQPKTHERVKALMETGKPLRN